MGVGTDGLGGSGRRGVSAGPPSENRVPGDWDCYACSEMNFARRESCRKCGGPKEVGWDIVLGLIVFSGRLLDLMGEGMGIGTVLHANT
jgi:hypothetical protein